MITQPPERIAVIGAGVAGLTAAWLLQRKYRVDLYEKNDYAGGHARTIVLQDGPDAGTPVDTGFIVMNHRNYPVLTRIFKELAIDLRDSDMSFGYACEATGYAYAGTNAGALFAQSSNLWNRAHWRMILDIVRFNKQATQDLAEGRVNGESLHEYIAAGGYSRPFADHYLLAMGSAIWSAPSAALYEFPARAFLHFLHNHGLLSVNDRPTWRYVHGGSQTYVAKICAGLNECSKLSRPVRRVRREPGGAVLVFKDGCETAYDRVVLATHADEALALLEDPSSDEKSLLGAWHYQENDAVLHYDETVMPKAPRAWASWNFVREATSADEQPVSVTYYMNRLQRLRTQRKYFVSLNRTHRIPDEKIVDQTLFTHPLYTHRSLATQPRLRELNGNRNTYFCGSYFGYGFHEDAARSGVEVAALMGVTW